MQRKGMDEKSLRMKSKSKDEIKSKDGKEE